MHGPLAGESSCALPLSGSRQDLPNSPSGVACRHVISSWGLRCPAAVPAERPCRETPIDLGALSGSPTSRPSHKSAHRLPGAHPSRPVLTFAPRAAHRSLTTPHRVLATSEVDTNMGAHRSAVPSRYSAMRRVKSGTRTNAPGAQTPQRGPPSELLASLPASWHA